MVSQVAEYDKPSVLLEDRESAFSRLMEASKVDDAAAVSAGVQAPTDASSPTVNTASV